MDQAFRDHLRRDDIRGAGAWLVRHHAAEVRGLCVAMCGLEGEDLAQDVFIKAFAAMAGFRGEASSRTWLLAIARNRCLDHLRRQQRAPVELEDEFDVEGPVDDAPLPSWMVANRDEVRRALDVLAEVPRAMIQLRFVHGLDYGELSGVFGIAPGTARMRVSRALARMRLELAPPPMEAAESLCLYEPEMDAQIQDAGVFGGAPPAAAPAALPPAPAPPPTRSRSRRILGRPTPPPQPEFSRVLVALTLPTGRYEARLVELTRALPSGR